MWTLLVGFALTLASIRFSAETQASWSMFLNKHSLFVVVGGTLGVLILSNPPSVLLTLAKAFLFLFSKEEHIADFAEEFRELENKKALGTKSSNELIQGAILLWESGVSSEAFLTLLDKKRIELEHKYYDALAALRNLSKYPPAFGMTGTVFGLVTLFSQLDQDSKAGIGPALAFAMTATFLGLVMANAIVSPLADRMQVVMAARKRLYQETFRCLALIHEGESLAILETQNTGKKKRVA